MNDSRAIIDDAVRRLGEPRGEWRAAARQRVKEAALRGAGLAACALHVTFGRRPPADFGILTYHRVVEATPGLPFPHFNVTPRRFRLQLEGLLRRGFRFWPLQRVLSAAAAGGAIPPRTVVVTFDDGYRNVYRQAWPALYDLEVPATVFLATAYLDQDEPFWFDAWGRAFHGRAPGEAYLPLTVGECRQMARGGLVSFGAHTHTHEDFRGRPDDLELDLRRSVEVVRELFQTEQIPFAFPFGFAEPAMIEAARRSGAACGLTTRPANVAPQTDPFGWGRYSVYPWDTGATLAAKLSGWYGWAQRSWQAAAEAASRRGQSRPSPAAPTPHTGAGLSRSAAS
jgi:peptidoglycan/xylan/chitin deacetylase (PgdA/CDA1 family)